MIPDHVFGILDGLLVAVVVFGLGIWQLVSINREIARDKQAKADSESPQGDSPEGAGHSVGEHRLDDR